MIRLLMTMALLAAGAPALAADIYVMRHLERDAGADPSLNAAGVESAGRLGRWFRHDPPRTIYVTGFKRSRETAAPLAARLGITPIPYDHKQPAAMIAAARASETPVLIVAHSDTVPAIVEALGGPAGPDLAHDDYGRVWIVRAGGKVRVAKLIEAQPD